MKRNNPGRPSLVQRVKSHAFSCVMVTFVSILVPSGSAPLSAASIPASVPRSTTTAEQSLFAAANRERAARGIPVLRYDPVLAEAARFHALQMATREDISHQFAGEPDLEERGSRAGVHFSLISENVGEAPNSAMFHELWMHSKGHRENLLDPEVNSIGIAVVNRNGQFYAVEDFAATVESLSFDQQEDVVGQTLAKAGMEVGPNGSTSSQAQARLACKMDSGFPGANKPWYIMRYSPDRLDHLPSRLKSQIQSGQYRQAVVGACQESTGGSFSGYNIAVLLYP